MLIRACYLLASSALYRQATEQVERYTATGMRLLERTRDPVQQAQFQRLRGGLFCLQGAYDKSRYYLLEAMDALRGQPRSTAVRLQLAAVYCDYGRVCRQRLEYADACSYYKRALSLLGDPGPGPAASGSMSITGGPLLPWRTIPGPVSCFSMGMTTRKFPASCGAGQPPQPTPPIIRPWRGTTSGRRSAWPMPSPASSG